MKFLIKLGLVALAALSSFVALLPMRADAALSMNDFVQVWVKDPAADNSHCDAQYVKQLRGMTSLLAGGLAIDYDSENNGVHWAFQKQYSLGKTKLSDGETQEVSIKDNQLQSIFRAGFFHRIQMVTTLTLASDGRLEEINKNLRNNEETTCRYSLLHPETYGKLVTGVTLTQDGTVLGSCSFELSSTRQPTCAIHGLAMVVIGNDPDHYIWEPRPDGSVVISRTAERVNAETTFPIIYSVDVHGSHLDETTYAVPYFLSRKIGAAELTFTFSK